MVRKTKRIGIYAGTFDPVHAGHIGFALQAIEIAKLEKVFFLPERKPRHKPDVEHFGHRTAMITRAIRPHTKLVLLELPDIYFDVARTLPKLQKEFANQQIVFLMGADVAKQIETWPGIKKLLKQCELIVGLRSNDQKPDVIKKLELSGLDFSKLTLIESAAPHVASSKIREALRHKGSARGLLSSVRRYARAQWLYVSVSDK